RRASDLEGAQKASECWHAPVIASARFVMPQFVRPSGARAACRYILADSPIFEGPAAHPPPEGAFPSLGCAAGCYCPTAPFPFSRGPPAPSARGRLHEFRTLAERLPAARRATPWP